MYRTEPHPDPYANQYPPPPPLAPELHGSNIQQTYTPPVPHPSMYPPEVPHSMPTHLQETPASGQYGGYHQPSVPAMHDSQAYYGHTAVDPQAVTMAEYRQTEQNEQHYIGQQQQPQHESYYMDYHDEPDLTSSHTPMVSPPQPPFLHHDNKQPSSQQTVQPEDIDSYKSAATQQQQQQQQKHNNKYLAAAAGPRMAPEDEQQAYRPKYYDDDDDRRKGNSGCNCCCYNPAMTCCSCFCFLISLGFLAAGIALMIAAKVIGDKCNAQCGDVVDKASSYGVNAQPCDAICGKVVHDGMFYGGIAVAALAAIAAIWKIFMWMCAAGSRR